jgi:glycosyltransferase involved in cell wall biosynthesis
MFRIAQCNDTFLPVVDGVGRVTYEYARALGERGHDCYVVTPLRNGGCRGKYPFEIVDFIGVPLKRLPQYSAGVAVLDSTIWRAWKAYSLTWCTRTAPVRRGWRRYALRQS